MAEPADPPNGCGNEELQISQAYMERKLQMLRQLVAQPIPADACDTCPSQVGEGLFVGNKKHAKDVETLVSLGVTGALNCAPTGISSLNLDVYTENGITYGFTNVSQDNYGYPILHDRSGVRSEHLETAKTFYDRIRQTGGKVFFFCVAGQNRSATLAIAVQILQGKALQEVLTLAAKVRPWILENVGFQRQLVELEALEESYRRQGTHPSMPLGDLPPEVKRRRLKVECIDSDHVEVELLVSGVCTMAAVIPVEATIDTVRKVLLERVNAYLRYERQCEVGKSWLLFTMFALPVEFDLVLEEAAVEVKVQIARLQSTFGLHIVKCPDISEAGPNTALRWNDRCRFEVCIFSVLKDSVHEPFTFRHQERPGAPGTLLAENFLDTNLRAWDFTSGEAFRSIEPIIFSFSDDPRSKRDFMNISTSKTERQQFNHPGEGGILGMGANAIVHRVELEAVEKEPQVVDGNLKKLRRLSSDHNIERRWDAAVKRPFGLWKMLASMEHKSEAGVAKRLRMAGALNKQGRLLDFYGLGIALASNNNNHDEYKFEVTLLSQYQEDFSSYTLKQFMDDYTKVLAHGNLSPQEHWRIKDLQSKFSLIKVKVLLVSLLNGFRDLTLMGVQAFDFNHMNNVLISRDCRKARLIDIDGNSKGSIQYPSEYIQGSGEEDLFKPALDVDLSLVLPVVVQHLICGKGRGTHFVTELISKVRRAKNDDEAKDLLRCIVQEDFFRHHDGDDVEKT